jgi:hypothetical protein
MSPTPVAFVTGASRGIGRETSLALAEAGFDVVVAARTVTGSEVHDYGSSAKQSLERSMPGSLEETAEQIRERGQQAAVVRLDLLDRSSVVQAAKEASEAFGSIDLLVNNAVYQGPGTMDRVLDLELGHVETIYLANVVHQLLLVQLVMPAMIERGNGTIVNVVSAAGMSDPMQPPESGGWGFAYSSSKAALIRMSGCLLAENRESGVRFFNMEPGLILTESMKAQGLDEALIKHHGGAPPIVPAAVIRWLVTAAEANEWNGKTLHAQPHAKKLGLVPGWPPGQ